MTLTYPKVIGSLEVYMDVLRALCGPTEGKSMIDLCCCYAPNTPTLGFSKRTYVDVIPRNLDHKSEQEFFVCADVVKDTHLHIFAPGMYWDVALCLDGIEHLDVSDGEHLLMNMELHSSKQVIFTPTTDLFGMAKPENKHPEAHRSLWSPEMMPGYSCIVFPDYHSVWNGGAFFAFRCDNMEEEFERVKNELSTKHWAN